MHMMCTMYCWCCPPCCAHNVHHIVHMMCNLVFENSQKSTSDFNVWQIFSVLHLFLDLVSFQKSVFVVGQDLPWVMIVHGSGWTVGHDCSWVMLVHGSGWTMGQVIIHTVKKHDKFFSESGRSGRIGTWQICGLNKFDHVTWLYWNILVAWQCISLNFSGIVESLPVIHVVFCSYDRFTQTSWNCWAVDVLLSSIGHNLLEQRPCKLYLLANYFPCLIWIVVEFHSFWKIIQIEFQNDNIEFYSNVSSFLALISSVSNLLWMKTQKGEY